jgi:hypothetical protein
VTNPIHACRRPEVKSEEENKENSAKRPFNRNQFDSWPLGTRHGLHCQCLDVNAKFNRSEDRVKVLSAHEREKKKKRASGLASSNVGTFLRMWHLQMVSSAKKPQSCQRRCPPCSPRSGCSEDCGHVNARTCIAIAIVRAPHLCIRESCFPTSEMSHRLLQWEDKAGLGLFRHQRSTDPTDPTPSPQPPRTNWTKTFIAKIRQTHAAGILQG